MAASVKADTVHPATQFQKISSALFYGISSILIIFVNKIVLTNYGFPSFLCLGIGQMVATIVVLFSARMAGLVTFPALSRDIPRKVFPLPLIYVLNLVSGLGGTKKINLPMFTCLRRFSIPMTMMLEYIILGVRATFAVKVSIVLMVLGAGVAALYDLTFDAVGYSLIFMNDICTASNVVFMKQKLDSKDLGKYGLLFYNSLFMLIPAIIIAYFTGDIEKALSYPRWSEPLFLAQFVVSCICGFVLNYSIVLSTHYNSALTTTCIGPIKNLFVTYVGMFSSGDYIFGWTNFLGINISVFGSILYTYVTFRQKGSGQKTVQVKPKMNGDPPAKQPLI